MKFCDDDCFCCCEWDCPCAEGIEDDRPQCTPECVCRCNGAWE